MIDISTVLRAGCFVLSAGAGAGWCWRAGAGAGAGAGAAAAQAAANDPRLRVLSPAEGSFVSGVIALACRGSTRRGGDERRLLRRRAPVVHASPGRRSSAPGTPAPQSSSTRSASSRISSAAAASCVRFARKASRYTENVEVDVVQVTATVVDGRGRYVQGLPQSAFHVSEDDRPQTISHFAAEDVPLELIVAVDISGSMGPSMPKMKKAVKEFLAAVPARHQVTLLGFNDTVIPLTRGQQESRGSPEGGRSARGVGGNRAVRRDSERRRHAGPPGRPQGGRGLQRW